MNDIVRDIYKSTVNGDQAGIAGKIQQALNQGVDPEIILITP